MKRTDPITPRLRGAFLGLAVSAAFLGACGEGPAELAPPPQAPQGAVVGVGSSWILATEVERYVECVAILEPTETRPSWLRKALTNVVLPTKLAAELVPDDRLLARERARAAYAKLVDAGNADSLGLPIQRVQGNVFDVGLQRWILARELEMNQWSAIEEEPGTFLILRVIDRPRADEWAANSLIEIEYIHFPFLAPEDGLAELLEQARTEINIWAADPAWEWILPQFYQSS